MSESNGDSPRTRQTRKPNMVQFRERLLESYRDSHAGRASAVKSPVLLLLTSKTERGEALGITKRCDNCQKDQGHVTQFKHSNRKYKQVYVCDACLPDVFERSGKKITIARP
ncbi:MAG: hypothetical protein HZC40_22800 [Chloroflexi bacterium]|nr:hypothetical protein [Chloroflexota bacterium]